MKKAIMTGLVLFILSITFMCTAESSSYYVTYNSNGYGSAPSPQTKEPGEDLILSTQIGYNFLGWADSPDADVAQYVPGDIYTKDKNITLYAVWHEAFDIGKIGIILTADASPCSLFGQSCYVSFSVLETGVYRIRSTNGCFDSSITWGGVHVYSIQPYWSTVSSGEYVNSGANRDFDITAELQYGKKYALQYCCPENITHIVFEPLFKSELLNASVVLPLEVSEIESEAFSSTSVLSVYIPENVKTIRQGAFTNCPYLEKVIISSSNTTIEDNAFDNTHKILFIVPQGFQGFTYLGSNFDVYEY